MYQLNLNQEQKDLLEFLICEIYHSKFHKVINAKDMLKYPLTKEATNAYEEIVTEFSIINTLHDSLHNLQIIMPVHIQPIPEDKVSNESVPPRNQDAIPTIIDSITGKTYVKLDLDMLLRVYSKLAIYKEQVASENQSNFKFNKLKSVVEGHNYIGNLIRTLSK